LTTPGYWIYTAITKEPITIECPHSIKNTEIINSGIISILPGCKIRAKTATMSHSSTQTVKFIHHFSPTNNLSIHQLYEPIYNEYKINLSDPIQEIWTSNQSNIEATFEDIIDKAQQIRNRKLQNKAIVLYSATTCSIGVLGILLLIAFLLQRSPCTRKVIDTHYKDCCLIGQRKEESTPHSSVTYKNGNHEAEAAQSNTEPADKTSSANQ
jgi:hypothetical protein